MAKVFRLHAKKPKQPAVDLITPVKTRQNGSCLPVWEQISVLTCVSVRHDFLHKFISDESATH